MKAKVVLPVVFCTLSLLTCIVVLIFAVVWKPSKEEAETLPTVYQYFGDSQDQITSGLVADADGFKLNGKPVRLRSGSIHYFRVHPGNWRDRMKKLRATGAIAVETYVAWNFHEPMKDIWDFGDGDHEHSAFANLPRFLEIAKEEDLLVILRPGPYITAEWEMGGHPSYLVRDPDMKYRTMYQGYVDRVAVYLQKLFEHVGKFQFTKGGSIIALQIENEYAFADINQPEYLAFLKERFEANGITELLFTSDNARMGTGGSHPDLLSTINFGPYQRNDPKTEIDTLLSFQPDKPVWAMEFWPGWFDAWFEENHNTVHVEDFARSVETLLAPPYNGSVNFFMFHGGTNYGFTTGATEWSGQPYAPVTTSYDYDAILSEAGDYTLKYYRVLDAFSRYQEPLLSRPLMPPQSRKFAFPSLELQAFLTFTDLLEQVPSTAKFNLAERTNMEMLDMNNGSGQRQGYILYRKRNNFTQGIYTFVAGMVRDFGILMVDTVRQEFPKNEDGLEQIWFRSTQEYNLDFAEGEHTIDLLVDTLGRTHGGIFPSVLHHKGLVRNLTEDTIDFYHLNGEEITDIEVVAMEFKSSWVNSLDGWRNAAGEVLTGPVLIQSTFTIQDATMPDTFLDMTGWTKGIAFVNGFNLGKYWNVGPTRTLYVPSTVLHTGINTVTIFEQLEVGGSIVFSAIPLLGPLKG